jgi:carbonic anhydrase
LQQQRSDQANSFEKGDLPLPPAKGVAAVACMDARLDVHKNMGLEEGARIQASPFIPHKESVRGFIYEVETGRLREIS